MSADPCFERAYLLHYNEILYARSLITKEQYEAMIRRINGSAKALS